MHCGGYGDCGVRVGEEELGLGPGSKVGAGSTSRGASALGTKGSSGAVLGPVRRDEGSCWPGWGVGFGVHSVIVWGDGC